MLQEIALQSGLAQLRLCRTELAQGSCKIEPGGDTPVITKACYLDRFLIRDDRLAEHLKFLVDAANCKIVSGQVRLQTQPRRRKLGGTGLCETLPFMCEVAYLIPEIWFPRSRRQDFV